MKKYLSVLMGGEMKKIIISMALLSVIVSTGAMNSPAALKEGETLTESNWLDMTVGFKPDPGVLGGLKSGEVLDATNMEKAKDAIPEGIKLLMTKYGLKLPLRDYAPILPSK